MLFFQYASLLLCSWYRAGRIFPGPCCGLAMGNNNVQQQSGNFSGNIILYYGTKNVVEHTLELYIWKMNFLYCYWFRVTTPLAWFRDHSVMS